jgi:hypothetical protein
MLGIRRSSIRCVGVALHMHATHTIRRADARHKAEMYVGCMRPSATSACSLKLVSNRARRC